MYCSGHSEHCLFTSGTLIPKMNSLFPLLSSSLPRTSHHQNYKRWHHSGDGLGGDKQQSLHSASMPLPKCHIHRTLSELQLVERTRQAEYEDAMMYARLVAGMASQCMVRGYVHPLTKKSIQDIIRTKQADEEDLLKVHEEDLEDDDNDWGLSYDERLDDQERGDGPGWVSTPLPCHSVGTAPMVVKTHRQDDKCMFSLEL